MTTIRVYEPALCCNTGVCGPELDQSLVTFTADLHALKEQGVDVARANLASDPGVFVQSPIVVNFLQAAGSEGLPLVLVDDVTVLTGRYPTRDEMQRWAAIPQGSWTELPLVTSSKSSGGCCGGGSEQSTGCC